ncbi:MAG TPA: PTS IIA-like nitrogen regulatory protein PtsN [Hyphomicrobiaceae bacterium]|nr:PTS IIA-like nitrogen regulatory protein PtsN [Hyphomicrobiaceae bacterium]
MDLGDMITLDGIIPVLRAKSKKQVLQDLAQRAATITGLPSREIFETLLQRERLGSTGVGRGIAIPHGKLPGLKRMQSLFARLETPVAFEAHDDEPVDLIFLLLAPEHAGADHLKALARVSRLLREASAAEKLRSTTDRNVIYALLTQPVTSHAA